MARGLTTDDLVVTVKRRGNIPVSNNATDKQDTIDILNEEMNSYMMPRILKTHESFYSYDVTVPLLNNVRQYKIPYRAISGHCESLQYFQPSGTGILSDGNFYNMGRIEVNDRPTENNTFHGIDKFRFYMQNDSIFIQNTNPSSTDSLIFSIYLRPNKLVQNSQGAQIIQINPDFLTITINNYSNIIGNFFNFNGYNLTGTASASSSGFFQCATSNNVTASNLATAINSDPIISTLMSASVVNNSVTVTMLSTTQIAITYSGLTEASVGLPQKTLVLNQTPSAYVSNTMFDFIQYVSPNKIMAYDVPVQNINSTLNTITFNRDDIKDGTGMPVTYVINDYINIAEETCVPQMPLELQPLLAQKACCKLLEAQGDADSIKLAWAELKRLEENTGVLLYNRIEASPLKVHNNQSILRKFAFGNGRVFR